MKLKEYAKAIAVILQEFPESENWEVIYSHDDEGNEYQGVIQLPSPCKIDEEQFKKSYRFLEVDFLEPENMRKCNAICIN